MKRLLLAFTLLAAVSAQARFTAERALLTAPVQVTAPMLPAVARDLADYAREGRLDHSQRAAFGAQSRIVAIDSVQVVLQPDSAQTLSFTLLPMKGDTIIAAIKTLGNDSRLTLYSRQWQPLPKLWHEPGIKEWLNEAGVRNRQKAEDSNLFLMSEYALDPVTGILTLYNRSENQQYLKPFLRYQWNGKAFKPLAK